MFARVQCVAPVDPCSIVSVSSLSSPGMWITTTRTYLHLMQQTQQWALAFISACMRQMFPGHKGSMLVHASLPPRLRVHEPKPKPSSDASLLTAVLLARPVRSLLPCNLQGQNQHAYVRCATWSTVVGRRHGWVWPFPIPAPSLVDEARG